MFLDVFVLSLAWVQMAQVQIGNEHYTVEPTSEWGKLICDGLCMTTERT